MRTLCAAVLLALTACGGGEPEADIAADDGPVADVAHNTLTPAETDAGWILLFDGVSTDGWRGYLSESFPERGWAVEDGNLVVFASDGSEEGLGGDIVTVQEFGDFELVFDFRVSPVGNSGVFYRVQDVDGTAMWEVAPEFQVLDDTAYIDMGTMDMNTHLTGDNYDLQSSVVTASNPIGEWNVAQIVVDRTHVEHWLNGQMTVEYDYYSDEWTAQVANSKFDPDVYGTTPTGSIGLQDHGHDVRYRNMKIRPLGAGR
mgnify:CR=1 FL=1